MTRVLYITANPKPVQDSFSLSVGMAFLNAYREVNPQDEIIELDLYGIQIPLVDADVFSGWGKLQQGTAFEQLSADEKTKVGQIDKLCDQFLSGDKYVIVSPMWNLSIPPMLKAYIDTICIAGKTFKYTETGPVGLLTGKKAVHIQARGGVYTEGPGKDFEFGDRYVRSMLSFLGVGPIDSVIAEGMAQVPDQAETIKNNAIERAKEVAKNF
ncbi:FMN-dependent NADH-azoreductase AzoRB [Paradesulfitobacterium aromaticivorans]